MKYRIRILYQIRDVVTVYTARKGLMRERNELRSLRDYRPVQRVGNDERRARKLRYDIVLIRREAVAFPRLMSNISRPACNLFRLSA